MREGRDGSADGRRTTPAHRRSRPRTAEDAGAAMSGTASRCVWKIRANNCRGQLMGGAVPETLTNRLDQAFSYAHEVHAGQVAKGTSVPYLGHLMGVASIVSWTMAVRRTKQSQLCCTTPPRTHGGRARLEDIRIAVRRRGRAHRRRLHRQLGHAKAAVARPQAVVHRARADAGAVQPARIGCRQGPQHLRRCYGTCATTARPCGRATRQRRRRARVLRVAGPRLPSGWRRQARRRARADRPRHPARDGILINGQDHAAATPPATAHTL